MSTVGTYPRRVAVLLVVAVLIVSTLPATVALAQIGETEPNDEQSAATPITIGEAVEGEIATGDTDWFGLDGVEAGESVEVTMSVPTGSDRLFAYLYGPNGYITGSGYVDPGETADFGSIAVQSGTYYVTVDATGEETGTYSFEVTTVGTDEFEPNQQQSTAVPIEQDAEMTGEITYEDEDWFSFDGVEAGQAVEVTMSVPTDSDRLFAYLYGPNGYITSTGYVDPGETAEVGSVAVQSGTHYVVVDGTGLETGSYAFEVTTAETDEFEPNQQQSTATPISRGTEVSGEITYEDEDWFSFDGVDAGESVNVTMSVPTDSDRLFAYLYGPNGYIASSGYVDPGETVEFGTTAVQSGTYSLVVDGTGLETGSYTFEVESSVTDEYEPNENAATAAAVSLGTGISAEITAGDDDWFALDGVEAGQALTLDFEKSADADRLGVVLYGPPAGNDPGNVLTSRVDLAYVNVGESTVSVGGIAERSGTVYVHVSAVLGDETGSYSFTVGAADTDDFEPNERLETAVPIGPDGNASGNITINDQDWFAVENVSAGQNVTGSVAASADSGRLYLSLYAPDGSRLDFDVVGDSDGSEVGATAAQSGTYYVVVTSPLRETGSYDLTVSGGDPVPPQRPTAAVVFDDQTSDGDEVRIASAILSEGGFVAVHDESGAIVGVSDYLANGTHEDVAVTLDPELGETATLTAMAHTDDGDGAFNASADGPYTVDGAPVTDDAVVTVEDDPDPEPTAGLDVSDQTGNGTALAVVRATASVDFDVVVSVDGAALNESSFDADETFVGSLALDPALTEDATVTVEIRDAATDSSLASEEIEYTLESVEPELDYYQVDFAVGDPIEDLGESLYAEEDRLLRFAWGNTDEGITDRGSAWPSADIRDSIDYGHIGSDDGEATVTFTVADGEELTVSLVVYSMPDAAFDPETADEQELLTAETGTYGAGTHTITVDLPDDD